MATSNRRDITLGVGIETSGEENLRALTGDVRGIATAAGTAAPAVDQLARELDQLTAATATKRTAERAAQADAVAARAELDARRDALARTRAAADADTRATAEHQAAVRAERLAVIDAGAALRERRAALTAATREAQQAACR